VVRRCNFSRHEWPYLVEVNWVGGEVACSGHAVVQAEKVEVEDGLEHVEGAWHFNITTVGIHVHW
jgi:hypothetical protein